MNIMVRCISRLQAHQQIEDLRLDRDVERRDRTRRRSAARAPGQRAGDADPLALAAAQRRRPARREIGGQADRRHQLLDARLRIAAAGQTPMDAQHLGQRLARRSACGLSEACGSWKTICARLAKARTGPAWSSASTSAPSKSTRPAVGFDQAQHRAAERALAAAAFADQAQRLAARELETDAVRPRGPSGAGSG